MTDGISTLLVIDDEENMRHMLSAMLARHGYVVSTASDGRAGLTMLSENHYDFILCDIKMPVMDGMAFLKNAKKVAHAATIIMMSAFGSIDLALEAMKLGAYDYISKPFKNDEVLLTLKKAEERERLIRENRQLKQQVEQLTASKRYGRMIA
ncbi:MAG: response regulator, partial [Thermodesulfobacteriota bacterium]|nr:response regulator [Thermodesulfobacteriota bacterium]